MPNPRLLRNSLDYTQSLQLPADVSAQPEKWSHRTFGLYMHTSTIPSYEGVSTMKRIQTVTVYGCSSLNKPKFGLLFTASRSSHKFYSLFRCQQTEEKKKNSRCWWDNQHFLYPLKELSTGIVDAHLFGCQNVAVAPFKLEWKIGKTS